MASAVGLERGVIDYLIVNGLEGNGATGAVITIGLDQRSRLKIARCCYCGDDTTSITIGLYLPCYGELSRLEVEVTTRAVIAVCLQYGVCLGDHLRGGDIDIAPYSTDLGIVYWVRQRSGISGNGSSALCSDAVTCSKRNRSTSGIGGC